MNGKVIVMMRGYGNPDFGQYGDTAPIRFAECQDVQQASRACRMYIEQWDLGGGNWGPDSGRVFEDGDEIGCISYNGRFWPEGSEYAAEMRRCRKANARAALAVHAARRAS